MDLPRSSLLGRLQAFLPEMEKANRETEKLAEEGKLAVLDDKLEVVDSDGRKDQVEDTDSEDDEEENEGEENEGEEGRGGERAGEAVPPRSVQLDFALGNFDDTPIAKMEAEKENTEAGDTARTATATGDEENAPGGTEQDAVSNLIITPEMGAKSARGASRQTKPCKPLIEEL